MAYFHCLIGGGSSGGGYELTVTCDADFAGTTITCTDGVTTLTQTCPSASPYEVTFEIPNGGDWTISGVVGGHTVSTGVSIPTSAELIATIQQTVTIHSAKEDTISYTDIDGATQTITFASGETSKQVQITIEPNGSSITFTSSVAKNPNDLSQDYSKTFIITTNTTELYLMPENALYWWGFEDSNLEDVTSANGWTWNASMIAPTHQTHGLLLQGSSTVNLQGVGSKTNVGVNKVNAICNSTSATTGYAQLVLQSSKNISDSSAVIAFVELANGVVSVVSNSTAYIRIAVAGANNTSTVNALWYE